MNGNIFTVYSEMHLLLFRSSSSYLSAFPFNFEDTLGECKKFLSKSLKKKKATSIIRKMKEGVIFSTWYI